jgi:hypothetical protein
VQFDDVIPRYFGVQIYPQLLIKTFIPYSVIKFVRFLVRAQMPTEAGNKAVKNPKFLQDIEDFIKKVNAEAAYFFEAGGDRTMAFIVNMESADMIPSIAEPLFQDMGAKVEFHPVMLLDDLKKALGRS